MVANNENAEDPCIVRIKKILGELSEKDLLIAKLLCSLEMNDDAIVKDILAERQWRKIEEHINATFPALSPGQREYFRSRLKGDLDSYNSILAKIAELLKEAQEAEAEAGAPKNDPPPNA